MKDLTIQELEKAPHLIQGLVLCSITKTPIGLDILNKAMNDHPEYFPDEIAHRNKYNAIPQHVHNSYFKELNEMHNEIFKDLPKNGLMWYIHNPTEAIEWQKQYDALRAVEIPKEKALHDKYYKEYGI